MLAAIATNRTQIRARERSYRAALELIDDHLRRSRHLVARELHTVDRHEDLPARGHGGKPGREDDDELRTLLGEVTGHPLLTLAPVRQDLRSHQPHEVDDRTPRDEGDGADVVQGKAGGGWRVPGDPVAEVNLH